MDMNSDLLNNFKDLLLESNIPIPTNELSESQKDAFELFKKRKNFMILGSGGCGKSYLIREMKNYIKNESGLNIEITATTGIASYNLNGITIYSFMGFGTGNGSIDVLLKKIKKNIYSYNRIKNIDILIIDEISMMSACIFEKMNIICQKIRRCNKFFGGIQIILSGDFLQLPPVFNQNKNKMNDEMDDERLLFESDLFLQTFNNIKKNIIKLNTNFRQTDKKFSELLQRLRIGECSKDDISLLNTRKIKNKKIQSSTIFLVASNFTAQKINNDFLTNIKYESKIYNTRIIESDKTDVCKNLTNELTFQFKQKGFLNLELKSGARVMLIKNIDVNNGLVNGICGTILNFINDFPLVLFDNGIKHLIQPIEFKLEYNENFSKAFQLPLILAWSITFHKCQSLTLDSAILDLENCFCDGQVYVALSRVRNLDGVLLHSFNSKKIRVNKKVIKYLNSI
jgi:ATP-dependent DNA helicase PIF1